MIYLFFCLMVVLTTFSPVRLYYWNMTDQIYFHWKKFCPSYRLAKHVTCFLRWSQSIRQFKRKYPLYSIRKPNICFNKVGTRYNREWLIDSSSVKLLTPAPTLQLRQFPYMQRCGRGSTTPRHRWMGNMLSTAIKTTNQVVLLSDE